MRSDGHQNPKTDDMFMIAWALLKADIEPVATRIKLYRGIATICGDPGERKRLLADAAALESADKSCREFALEFAKKHS